MRLSPHLLVVSLGALALIGASFPSRILAAPDAIFPGPEADLAVAQEQENRTDTVTLENNLRIAYFVDAWDRTDRRQILAMLDSWAPAFTTPVIRECVFQVFDQEEALAAAVRLRKFDAVCIYSYQMPTLGKALQLEPSLLIGSENAPQLSLVLLVRRNSGFQSIRELEGKNIIIDTANLGALPIMWLGQAAASDGLASTGQGGLQARLGLSTDSFNAIAPVFFGNADACVVSQQGFTENAGMNPQILQQLHQITKSPTFTTRVLTFPPDADRSKKSAILALRPSLKVDARTNGFLSPQNLTFYDVAEGDFDVFKNFEGRSLPDPPGTPMSGNPSLTATFKDEPVAAVPD